MIAYVGRANYAAGVLALRALGNNCKVGSEAIWGDAYTISRFHVSRTKSFVLAGFPVSDCHQVNLEQQNHNIAKNRCSSHSNK
jgi:hypothetical protein